MPVVEREVIRADDLICDRCGIAPHEITVLGRDLCGECYCRYASELVRNANRHDRDARRTAEPSRQTKRERP